MLEDGDASLDDEVLENVDFRDEEDVVEYVVAFRRDFIELPRVQVFFSSKYYTKQSKRKWGL